MGAGILTGRSSVFCSGAMKLVQLAAASLTDCFDCFDLDTKDVESIGSETNGDLEARWFVPSSMLLIHERSRC